MNCLLVVCKHLSGCLFTVVVRSDHDRYSVGSRPWFDRLTVVNNP